MGFQTTTIRYGWVALASLAVSFGAVTIYVLNNQRHQVKPQDIIELAVGLDERCMGIQTADGSYPVARPSFVRTWTSNVYTTNGVTIYTNIVTNTIGWHVDRDMMISLDTTISNLVPHYKNTNDNYSSLTWTGLFASLSIGDHTSRFTRTPCWTNNAGLTNATTNAATYGDYPWQIYVEDLQERYKVLYSLSYASNGYMWTSNSFIYIYRAVQDPPALSPYWFSDMNYSYVNYGGYAWDEAKADIETYWPESVDVHHDMAPHSTYEVWQNEGGYDWVVHAEGASGSYYIGPFTNDRMHAVTVKIRSVRDGDDWSAQGAVAAEDEWITVIAVTNSTTQWHSSPASYGSTALPLSPLTEPWIGDLSRGNTVEVSYEVWWYDAPSVWVLNGTVVTNTAFGSNCVFYYCTNKYW